MLFFEDIDNDGGGSGSSSGGHGNKPTRYRGKRKKGNTRQSTLHTRMMSTKTTPSAMRGGARVQRE